MQKCLHTYMGGDRFASNCRCCIGSYTRVVCGIVCNRCVGLSGCMQNLKVWVCGVRLR